MPSIDNSDLSNEVLWQGGCFEAAMVLGRSAASEADMRLHSAISEVWSLPRMGGCWSDRLGRAAVDPGTQPLDRIMSLFGWSHDHDAGAIAFKTVVVRESGDPDGEDWLYAAFPLGGLGKAWPSVGAWPAGDLENARSWIEPVERSLAEIALAVSRKVPFLIAAIDYEVAGIISDDARNGVFRESRRTAYVAPLDGVYRYLPTTDWSVL